MYSQLSVMFTPAQKTQLKNLKKPLTKQQTYFFQQQYRLMPVWNTLRILPKSWFPVSMYVHLWSIKNSKLILFKLSFCTTSSRKVIWCGYWERILAQEVNNSKFQWKNGMQIGTKHDIYITWQIPLGICYKKDCRKVIILQVKEL